MEQYGSLLSFAVLAVAFYLLLIRPQMRRQKEHQTLMSSLEVGDRIVTIGGIFGSIRSLEEERAGVEIAPNVVIEIARSAIAKKLAED